MTLSIEEINLILEGLGKLPFENVWQLIQKIQAQAQAQLPPRPTEPQPNGNLEPEPEEIPPDHFREPQPEATPSDG